MTYPITSKTSPAHWSETEVPLFPKMGIASSFSQRMRGLLGAPPEPQMLLIAPCRSIHTFGMDYPIHVAFFDRHGVVIEAETSVPPGSKRSCDQAVGVLEMPAVFHDENWFVCGDNLRLAPPDANRHMR